MKTEEKVLELLSEADPFIIISETRRAARVKKFQKYFGGGILETLRRFAFNRSSGLRACRVKNKLEELGKIPKMRSKGLPSLHWLIN